MIADGNGESLDTSRQQELEAGSIAGDCFFYLGKMVKRC